MDIYPVSDNDQVLVSIQAIAHCICFLVSRKNWVHQNESTPEFPVRRTWPISDQALDHRWQFVFNYYQYPSILIVYKPSDLSHLASQLPPLTLMFHSANR